MLGSSHFQMLSRAWPSCMFNPAGRFHDVLRQSPPEHGTNVPRFAALGGDRVEQFPIFGCRTRTQSPL